jgi:hypothetical protein
MPNHSCFQSAQEVKSQEKAEERQNAFKPPVEQRKVAPAREAAQEPTLESLRAKFSAEAKARSSRA